MTNEKKANEIAYSKAEGFTLHNGTIEKLFAECAMEMAQWKEQQMIDKAINWLSKRVFSYDDCFIEDFKQAIKGE